MWFTTTPAKAMNWDRPCRGVVSIMTAYYRLAEDRRYFINDTGTGNHAKSQPCPRAADGHGFRCAIGLNRFMLMDFASTLAQLLAGRPGASIPGQDFLMPSARIPCLSQLKLISEPWDPGPGGYQLGNHPPPFAEWNDRYRDTVRRYWRGDPGIRPELASRLSGSADIFNPPLRSGPGAPSILSRAMTE